MGTSDYLAGTGEYHVVDNFLEESVFAAIKKHMCDSGEFPWFYNSGVAFLSLEEHLYDFQLVHSFYRQDIGKSNQIAILAPLLAKINPSVIHRIKANFTPVFSEPKNSDWHTDLSDQRCTTAVFYLNSNNGYTVFKDGTKVESVANRLVYFDSLLEHASQSQTDTNYRVLINLNYD
jgi:hypothetical protein